MIYNILFKIQNIRTQEIKTFLASDLIAVIPIESEKQKTLEYLDSREGCKQLIKMYKNQLNELKNSIDVRLIDYRIIHDADSSKKVNIDEVQYKTFSETIQNYKNEVDNYVKDN